jgi:nucleoside-diphosphate-sugar epimerase
VLLVSRSGAGPAVAGVRREAADAADADRLTELAGGAAALHNCINPPSYDVWSTYWPPVAAAFLDAAERSGAVLVTASCLYGYGPVEVPMVEGMPDAAPGTKGRLRAAMWAGALARHQAGRIRAVEVRGSDYMGAGVGSAYIPLAAPRAVAGKGVWLLGRTDVPHSFTDVRDMGRALATVAVTESAWGRVWHAPTNPARTQAETIADVCRSVGRPPVRVHGVPRAVLSVGGVAVPLLREMRETVYQFERPYVLDSSAITRELGLAPTPWDDVCRATATGEVSATSLL